MHSAVPTAGRSAGTTAALRAAVVLAVAVALSLVHLPGRPPTLCLLRGTTGIPCPACGGTTAVVSLGGGDVLGALRASPLAVLGAAAFVLFTWVRKLGIVVNWRLVAVVVTASELWQLQRFGLL